MICAQLWDGAAGVEMPKGVVFLARMGTEHTSETHQIHSPKFFTINHIALKKKIKEEEDDDDD